MTKLGKKELTLQLQDPLAGIPAELAEWDLKLNDEGHELQYVFDTKAERTGIPSLLTKLRDLGIAFKDLNTRQSSLEDIFVSLVTDRSSR
jgi:ABC-2 type transport system ATP-binding protein